MAERTYLAGPAPLDELKRRGAPHGITRFVIVQPSFYGFDNSATLDALDELAGNGRGVAVIDPSNTPDATLADMHRRGIRGLRINLYSPLAADKRMDDSFAATAAVAKKMNWHIQVIAPLPVLLKSESLLRKLASADRDRSLRRLRQGAAGKRSGNPPAATCCAIRTSG